MSRLADIYKSEKSKGGGLFSTLGKRALEKLDPRQMFDQSGLAAALLPSMFKTYSATGGKASKLSPPASLTPLSSPTQPSISNSKIDSLISQNADIIANTQISAKNSLVLPVISRDMNVMRQNIAKLVKLQGGTPTNKADMFFKSSKEREAEYESKFGKSKETKPTQVGAKSEEKQGGIFGFLSKMLAPLLAIGGTIVGAITGVLSGLGTTLLNGIMSALSPANLMKAFGVVTEALGSILKIATMIATNPIFLAIAGITSIAALLSFLRSDFDKDKSRYMDLSIKKKEQGSLSETEQKELEKLERPVFRKEIISSLGYDPRTGKVVDKDTTPEQLNVQDQKQRQRVLEPGTAKEYLKSGEDFYKSEGYTKPQLELMAAGKKVDLSQPSGITPVQAPPSPPTPTVPSSPPAVPSSSSEGMQNYKSRAPSQVPSSTTDGVKNNSPTGMSSAILDMIAAGEAVGSDPYNSMNQGTPGGKISGSGISSKIIGKNLTDMTVGEILSRAPNKNEDAAQRKEKGAVFAAGRYQIIPETLQGLVNRKVVSKDEKFTTEVQDRLAMSLVQSSGATKSINDGDLEKAQYQLSKVWASLPVPAGMTLKSGEVSTGAQSFYGGITSNKAKEGLTLASLPGLGKSDTMVASVATSRPSDVPGSVIPASVVAASPSRPSSIISNSTLALSQIKEQTAGAPIVVNAPQTVNNMQQGVSAGGIQSMPASVVDGEFMKLLVSRTS